MIESESFIILSFYFDFWFIYLFLVGLLSTSISNNKNLSIYLWLGWLTLDTTVPRIDGRYRRQVNSSTSFLLYVAHTAKSSNTFLSLSLSLYLSLSFYPIQWQIGLHFRTSAQHPRNDKHYWFSDFDFALNAGDVGNQSKRSWKIKQMKKKDWRWNEREI